MSEPSTRRSDEVEIFVGDYLARIRHLEARAEAMEKAGADKAPRRSGTTSEYQAVVKERDALYEEARETALYVGTQAPRRSWWKKHAPEHPAQTGDDAPEMDQFFGFNTETFPEVLVPVGITYVKRGRAAEPRLWSDYSDLEREAFLDELGEGDFGALWVNITSLYRGNGVSPKLRPLGLRKSQESSETSD